MPFSRRRWICLLAATVIEVLLGIAYAWSVFQGPFTEKYGWSISGITGAYTLMCLVTMLFTVFGGEKLRRRLTIRREVFIGGVIYSAAIIGMSLMTGHLPELYFWWGLVLPVGTAMSYPVLLSYALQLFPDRTGLAGGLVSAGYALGSVIWAPLTTVITAAAGDISAAFRVLGILFLAGISLMALLLREVPPDFRRQLREGKKGERQKAPARRSFYNMGRREMLRTEVFYLAMASLLLALSCGNMVISQGSPIMTHHFAVSATEAALVVSLLSVANMGGRMLWGAASDRIGKVRTLGILHIIAAVFTAGLTVLQSQTLFVAALMGTIFAYGGATSMLAPVTEELFGPEYITENYSVTFCGYTLSGMIGPTLVSAIRQGTGSYTPAFLSAALFSGAGTVLCAVLLWKARRQGSSVGWPPCSPERRPAKRGGRGKKMRVKR